MVRHFSCSLVLEGMASGDSALRVIAIMKGAKPRAGELS